MTKQPSIDPGSDGFVTAVDGNVVSPMVPSEQNSKIDPAILISSGCRKRSNT